MNFKSRALVCAGVVLSLLVGFSVSHAQDGTPDDYDFAVDVLADGAVAPGASFNAEIVVAVRADGGQGWSYGISHDNALLELTEVALGGDADALESGGFADTAIGFDVDDSAIRGMTQGVVLSFVEPIFVPITDRFVMGVATYSVDADACGGSEDDITTPLGFTGNLSSRDGGPAVEVNFTVNGTSVVPAIQTDGEVVIGCAVDPEIIDLILLMDQDPVAPLPADRASTTTVNVLVDNNSQNLVEDLAAQAWEYAIELDGSVLEVAEFTVGADAAALNGNNGPDFEVHDELDDDEDGTIDAVIAGAVVDMEGDEATLPLPIDTDTEIGLLTLRSAININEGEPDQTTTLNFAVIEGDDVNSTIEVLFTIDGESVVPNFAQTLDITLTGAEGGAGRFIRGDANDDTRVDISDGIWIIQFLFYGGKQKPCLGAADANDDGTADIADSMYIFNYRLQPGATPGNLFPAPPAPFPDCGSDPDLTAEDCPIGSTRCDL